MTHPSSAEPSVLRGATRVVDSTLAAIRPLVTMWRDGLTLIPLEVELPQRASGYVTLDQALELDQLEVHEAPEQTVPFVEAATKLHAVLLLGGDTIIGGAQNRIVNLTILLKAAATTRIPVSCLELGRWDSGRRFAAGRQVDASMRGMVHRMVTENASGPMQGEPAYGADQSGIWEEIGRRQARSSMHSPTEALHDVYRAETDAVAELTRAFSYPPGARGVAAALFDRLIGVDLFDSAETLERQWPRLVEGYASALLDRRRAIEVGELPTPRHRHVDHGALDRMRGRARESLHGASVQRSVGEGSDVRFVGTRVHGSALVHNRRVIHLAMFREGA